MPFYFSRVASIKVYENHCGYTGPTSKTRQGGRRLKGKGLKAFLTKAVEHELERDADEKIARKRVSLPLVPSNRPGTLQLDADHIAQVLQ